jgi:peptidoglycan-associated lipoprotein
MVLIDRHIFAALPIALVLSAGCTSTSPAPDLGAQEVSEPVLETSDTDSVSAPQVAVALEPVYFDTNEAMLRADDRDLLKRHAESILGHPEWGVVTIGGHCDERGSDEYNRALGRRRAEAVENYLEVLGVPATRVTSRTFGEDRPAVLGHGESAWSYNRRSEFRIETLTSASF